MLSEWHREAAAELELAERAAGVAAARAALPQGPGTPECQECGADIPAARRAAMPGCTRCVQCQNQHEQPHNRRG
ncbi:TraR/DksA C4-type zinc finger protein [Chitiniphilus eburneus]|uniref:TraR/DksA C4-type zinc finger protein n=1 Tax=Chitiniphilus eburneus TaxID=2571148 RepID=UPI0035D0194B